MLKQPFYGLYPNLTGCLEKKKMSLTMSLVGLYPGNPSRIARGEVEEEEEEEHEEEEKEGDVEERATGFTQESEAPQRKKAM